MVYFWNNLNGDDYSTVKTHLINSFIGVTAAAGVIALVFFVVFVAGFNLAKTVCFSQQCTGGRGVVGRALVRMEGGSSPQGFSAMSGCGRGARRSIIGEGAHIHIFVFTDCEDN